MSEERDDQERPCLHCMMVELIDDFFAEYPATTGEPDTIDTDEVVTAIAKIVAELTCTIREQLIEQLMREIINYDAEFRGMLEQVQSAPMHGIRQFQRQRRPDSRLRSLRTVRTIVIRRGVRTPIGRCYAAIRLERTLARLAMKLKKRYPMKLA